MIIRPATDDDALAIMEGLQDFRSRMAFAGLMPESWDAGVEAVAGVLALDGVSVTVAERDGRVVGMIAMCYLPFLWDRERLMAEELFWWAAPDAPKSAALRLIRAALREAKARGAIAIFKRLTSSPEKLRSVYERCGLVEMETTYAGVF